MTSEKQNSEPYIFEASAYFLPQKEKKRVILIRFSQK